MYYNPDAGFSASSWLGTIADAMYNEYLDYREQRNVDSDSELSDDDRRRFGALIKLVAVLKPCLYSLSLAPEAIEQTRTFMRELGIDNDLILSSPIEIVQALQSHAILQHGLHIDSLAGPRLRCLRARKGDL